MLPIATILPTVFVGLGLAAIAVGGYGYWRAGRLADQTQRSKVKREALLLGCIGIGLVGLAFLVAAFSSDLSVAAKVVLFVIIAVVALIFRLAV